MEELARRVDQVLRDYDTYEYQDSDMSPDQTFSMLQNDPYEVIRILVEMAETLIP